MSLFNDDNDIRSGLCIDNTETNLKDAFSRMYEVVRIDVGMHALGEVRGHSGSRT